MNVTRGPKADCTGDVERVLVIVRLRERTVLLYENASHASVRNTESTVALLKLFDEYNTRNVVTPMSKPALCPLGCHSRGIEEGEECGGNQSERVILYTVKCSCCSLTVCAVNVCAVRVFMCRWNV